MRRERGEKEKRKRREREEKEERKRRERKDNVQFKLKSFYNGYFRLRFGWGIQFIVTQFFGTK